MRFPIQTMLVASAAIFMHMPTVHAAGCLKGAAVGGVAGHVAGGHGVVGAAAGCAIEHHREKKADKKAAAAATQGAQGASGASK